MMDIHEREYRYIPQMTVARNSLPGQNPLSDPSIAGELTGSVALAQAETNPTLTELGEFVPRVIYECKPVLAGHFELINNKAMIESLLQANYCLRFHKLQCLFAYLTDLITWQYYQVELSPDSLVSMKITAYYKIQHSLLLKEQDFLSHVFMSHVLNFMYEYRYMKNLIKYNLTLAKKFNHTMRYIVNIEQQWVCV